MKKSTLSKSMIASLLVFVICSMALVGTTFAWFTDSAESKNNIIKTGRLDVELYYQLQDQDGWTKVVRNTNMFSENSSWEPGHAEIVRLKVVNEGTLSLKYQFGINVSEEVGSVNSNGDSFKLSDIIRFGTVDGARLYSRTEAIEAVNLFSIPISSAYSADTATLLPKGSENVEDTEDVFTLVVYMPEEVGNEANRAPNAPQPRLNLGINLIATQLTAESDSFGNDYDEGAQIAGSYTALMAGKGKNGGYILNSDIEAENVIFYGNGTENTIDLNGNNVTAKNVDQFIFGMQNGGKLTVNGDGTVNCGKGFIANKGNAEITVNGGEYNMSVAGSTNATGKYHSIAQNNSIIVVNGGKFTSNVEDAALFLATSNSIIEINGGFFENIADDTPDLLDVGSSKNSTNRILIKGGTFVNYNPLEDKMTYTGEWPESYEQFVGPWILICEGYKVVSETQANGDVWYTVLPE